MLTLALAATLVGFALLVVGLFTGTVWLAVACIVVCLIGLAFLLVDILGIGRRRVRGTTSDSDVAATGGGAVSGTGGDDGSDRSAIEAGAVPRGVDAGPASDDVTGAAPHSGRHERPSGPAADRTDMQPDADRQDLQRPVVSPGAQAAAPDAAAHESATAPGTLDDYLATVGESQTAAGESQSRGVTDDPGDYPPTRSAAPSGPGSGSWPSYTSGLSESASSGAARTSEAPAGSGRHSGGEGREKFDPLDPRWRPPVD